MSERLATGSALLGAPLARIQDGAMRYTYKGVPTYKNPFDLALYQMLLWQQKPRTLIEIGSKWGGSALWFADILRSFGVDCVIHSIDITPPSISVPDVTFHRGDGRNLAATLPADLMENLPRPMFVIEDADHHCETTLAVLRFFDRWLVTGEYIVVEDGIVDDLYGPEYVARLMGGPRRAVELFLRDRGQNYEIDTGLCDHFGTNVTWNVNGYLRRVR